MAFDAEKSEAAESGPMARAGVPLVSVIIPTFHRPDGVTGAIRSVLAQEAAPPFEIIVMDNDAGGSGRKAVAALQAQAPGLIRYAIEPAPGVANARNSAVAMVRGTWVAFLDDDEAAQPQWLAALLQAADATDADVVFGPIEARLGPGAAEPRPFFQTFYSRLLDGPDRLIDKPYGCGNSLLKVATALNGPAPFDVGANETGGEDDRLWQAVAARGGRFGWARDAWVYEDVPDQRAGWAYMTRRSFAFGHHTSAQWFEPGRRDLLRGGLSMARGALQALALAPLALCLWLVRSPRWAWAYDKMLRGLGKLLWFGPFRQAFYGAAAARRVAKAARRSGTA